MVVGRKEKGDIKLDDYATLMVNKKKYEVPVYSDKKAPKRRDVFAPNTNGLPKQAKVKYLGREYIAKLSFRHGMKGAKIPVYQFFVTSSAA